MDKDLNFKIIKPDKSLADFVESFWLLHNPSESVKEIVILSGGRVESTFS